MSRKFYVGIAPLMLVALAACGGDSGSSGAGALKDAVAQALVDSPDSGDLPFEVDAELAG